MIRLNLPSFEIKLSGTKEQPRIFDILRHRYVALTPEEWVRQHFVHYLIEHKGYPAALMANEMSLCIGNKKLRARLDACLKRIHDGESFAQAALAENVLDPLYARMLINGERSGTYDETLSYLTSLISEDAARRTDRVVSVIEPACAALLTIAVALSLIAIIIPLMGVLGAIG